MMSLNTSCAAPDRGRSKNDFDPAAALGPHAETLLAVLNGRPVPDWTAASILNALSLASAHGLYPALLQRLPSASLSMVPSAAAAARQWQKWNTCRNLALLGETTRLLAALRADGITAVPFKGGVLGEIAHGGPHQRQAGDIDLFVQRKDLKAAVQTLRACGYQLDAHWNSAVQEGHFRFDCECEVVNSERQTCVDLHWEFTARNFSLPMPVEELFARLQPVRIQGEDILCFAAEDMVLLLCLHAAKHYWSRLEWSFTICEYIRRHPALDWDALLGRARQMQITRIVATGLCLAEGLFACAVPAIVQKWMDDIPHAARLAAIALEWVRAGTLKPSAFSVRRFHALGREGLGSQITYWMGVFFTPSEKDYARKLPAGFSWGYYLYRPLRLSAEWVMGLFRRQRQDGERPGVPSAIAASVGNSGG